MGDITGISEAWILTPFQQVRCFLLLTECEAHCFVGKIRHRGNAKD